MRAPRAKRWPGRPVVSIKNDGSNFGNICRRFGQPAWLTKKGDCKGLNERFWAELYKAEHQIVHERDEERFYEYEPKNGLWQVCTANTIKTAISDRMRSLPPKLRPPGLLEQDTERNRRNIVALLRGIAEKRDFFVDRPPAIHAANCMVLIDHGRIKTERFDARFRSRNQLVVDYDL